MNTIFIYDQCSLDRLSFFVLEGDFSHLDNVFINEGSGDTRLQDELSSLLFNKEGGYKRTFLHKFPIEAVVPGTKVIVTGFLP